MTDEELQRFGKVSKPPRENFAIQLKRPGRSGSDGRNLI
jgi:hypothetical protein